MKKIYAEEIKENENIETTFLVKDKKLAVGKTGKPYLVVHLMDKTGDIEGREWNDAERFSTFFKADDFVKVKGVVVSYMGKLQLKISNIKRVDDSEVNREDFSPVSKRSFDEMFSELKGIVDSIEDKYLFKLMLSIINDKSLSESLKHAPAAKAMHHVYLGGLLEHILSLCRLIDNVCDHYNSDKKIVNRDLLITGAILHDIGKTKELSYSRSFGYTDEGRLLGHITIGVEMVEEKIRKINGFPQQLSMLVKHMILSHHGQYDYGSPKRPKTMEATILSYLDDLDAKVNSIEAFIEKERNSETNWTSYHRLFERNIYTENFLEYEENDAKEPEKSNNAEKEENREKSELSHGRTMTLFENL